MYILVGCVSMEQLGLLSVSSALRECLRKFFFFIIIIFLL